jgi:hypothetical protein
MAQLTPTNRYVIALGPIKCEIAQFQGTITDSDGNTQTGVDDADTFESLLVRPVLGMGVDNTDGSDSANNMSIGIAADDKTVTINNASLSAANINVLVFGF